VLCPLLSSVADLTARDLVRALDLVRLLNSDDTDDEVARASLTALERFVGCDMSGVIGSDHVSRRLTSVRITQPERNMVHRPGFAAAVAQHPGFAAYRSGKLRLGSSAALTDLADLPALKRLPVYTDFYRPVRTVDQLLCVVELRGRRGSVLVFNRSRPGFSRRDRAVVDLLAPHVSQAMARRDRVTALLSTVRRAERDAARELSGLPELTPRELQVAARVADGATDAEIARDLGISVRTVHKHLEQIYRKLDVTNRGSLGALVHRAWAETDS
jgi:DNA-binding CsgD family transcriptional regulator